MSDMWPEELVDKKKSSLDDKLRALLADDNLISSHAVGTQPFDDAISQIKQAFADEGYVQHGIIQKPRKRYYAVAPGQVPPLEEPQQPCMTGQEWYDRFVRQYHMSADWIAGDETIGDDAEHDVLSAAKRAAGISE